MLFDVQAALAEILADSRATTATTATKRADVASVAGVAAHRPETATGDVLSFAPRPADDMFRHGRSVTGLPRTWTGRVVSLDDWRTLSTWDRDGPDGRLWCGICRAWVAEQAFPSCHDKETSRLTERGGKTK